MSNTPNDYYNGTRPDIYEFLPSEYTKVLEIGCGHGGFRPNLKANCEYWGVEPFSSAYNKASEVLNYTLHGTYDDVSSEIPNNYFDLIICNDVIEHMVDHDKFFDDIKSKMTNNGSIVGSIPNVRFLPNLLSLIFNKDWEYQDSGILDRTHLRFFTKKSLLRTITQHGYTIEKFNGINNLSYKPTSLRKMLKIISVNIIGKDTLSLQFAFRIKKLSLSN
ncbi:MAG: Class I SAM-dependent methyltransferase [uncultured Thiotrichaceae bacterium]|uniref:Class I SAM-dependent methyltransferase n=1 Tax=uncultured Thiotrichaceae bacterium TaxID=298394 RepID=A0A6S6T0V4_9GAMM|nr:MAG: Class I SAM-dependent methyltransferase [uncultured Thiotrichaceae bacterium]